MESVNESPGDPFIVSTSLAKPDAKTRRFIRSHVMRGKNTGKFMHSKERPRLHAGNRQGKTGAPGDSICGDEPKRQRREATGAAGWVLVTPRKVASEFSLLGFGDEMKPYAWDLIYRAFTIVKPAMYGMQDMALDGAQDDKLFCFANLAHHPGLLHSTIFAAQAFHDLAVGIPYGSIARLHLAKALRHLQKSLDDKEEAMGLSTLAIVASLAMAAVISGDLATASMHMDGLHNMVRLRGGLRSLGPGSMIEHKARAIDLGLAMALGHKLRFAQDDDISWSPQIAQSRPSATRFPELTPAFELRSKPDPRLLNIWADLREFSRLVNDATTHGTRVSLELATRLATSVPHKLLRLPPGEMLVSPNQDSSLHELLRLCMLAYAKILLIKLPGIGKKMTWLVDGLRIVLTAWHTDLQARRASEGKSDNGVGLFKLLLWGAFVASVSIFDGFDEKWLGRILAQTVSVLGLQTWTETKAVLKGFLWIDSVFDKPAERLFQQYYMFPYQ